MCRWLPSKKDEAQEETAKKVKDLANQLNAAEAELVEADTKMVEAEHELSLVLSGCCRRRAR